MKSCRSPRYRSCMVEPAVKNYFAVSAAVNQGLPLRLKEPKSKVLNDISILAEKLVPAEGNGSDKRIPSMFGGLIRALGIKK